MSVNYSRREKLREKMKRKFEKAGPIERGEILNPEDFDESENFNVWYEKK